MKKNLLTGICLVIFILPGIVLADAPPPSPIRVGVTHEGQEVSEEKFFAVLLTCQTDQEGTSAPDSFSSNYRDLKDTGQQGNQNTQLLQN